MTQNEKVLRHLKDYGSITPMEALEHYGIMRLAARVADLKSSGHDVRSTMMQGMNRYGEITRYAVYTLHLTA